MITDAVEKAISFWKSKIACAPHDADTRLQIFADAAEAVAKFVALGLLDKTENGLHDLADAHDFFGHEQDEINLLIGNRLRGAEPAHAKTQINGNGGEAPAVIGLGEVDAGEDDLLWGFIRPRGWLLGNIFCRGFLSSLLGDGGVGKTALRIVQLLSLATKRALTGEHVFERCRVLFLSLEDTRHELNRRIMAACKYHNISRADLSG